MKKTLIYSLFSLVFLCHCASRKHKDINYLSTIESKQTQPKLNIFEPNRTNEAKNPVVIFVHGGYWAEGNKNIYGFLGRNFAKKDIVTVIAGYTLSPNANYDTMAKQVAQAILWTQNNIKKYKGDPEQIYVMGHSAGGHLVALASTNPKYLNDANAVKGVILNDAAGLDMKSYLEKYPPTEKYNYDVTWTNNPENWKDASPIYFLDEETPPFLIYIGKKTYPSIINQNNDFVEALKPYQPNTEIIVLDKKHVPMMSHYFFPWTDRYDEILRFIEETR